MDAAYKDVLSTLEKSIIKRRPGQRESVSEKVLEKEIERQCIVHDALQKLLVKSII